MRETDEEETKRDAVRAPGSPRVFTSPDRPEPRTSGNGPPDATNTRSSPRRSNRSHKHTRNASKTTQDACKEYALKTESKQSAWSGATHLQKRTSKHAQLQRRLTSTAR